jgi:F0F1-type ATP synthase assembly protein I
MSARASELARKLIAVLVLMVAAYVLFKLVLGFVAAVTWVLVVLLAVVALVWALRTL